MKFHLQESKRKTNNQIRYTYIYLIYIYYTYIRLYIYYGYIIHIIYIYFNAHPKFTIIQQVYNKSLSQLKICTLLEHRESFWIEIACSFPQGLNISLNYPQDITGSIW